MGYFKTCRLYRTGIVWIERKQKNLLNTSVIKIVWTFCINFFNNHSYYVVNTSMGNKLFLLICSRTYYFFCQIISYLFFRFKRLLFCLRQNKTYLSHRRLALILISTKQAYFSQVGGGSGEWRQTYNSRRFCKLLKSMIVWSIHKRQWPDEKQERDGNNSHVRELRPPFNAIYQIFVILFNNYFAFFFINSK